MSELSEIRVNLAFRDRQLAEFLAIKEHLGIQTNADVVRYLVRRHARALQRREKLLTRPTAGGRRRKGAEAQRGEQDLTQRRQGAGTQGGNKDLTQRRGGEEAQREELTQRRGGAEAQWGGVETARRGGRRPPVQEEEVRVRPSELAHLCLDCPLPECDEGDARCPYQRATGGRERQRARTRAYMRRARAK